jgi:Bifunctional DNA primase/polymerase, N-terminal
MTDATLRQALAYARRGWPVFPCLPGQKIPATTHGYQDATTDEQQITSWFGRGQRWNLAIATGLWGSRTRPPVLTCASMRLARTH